MATNGSSRNAKLRLAARKKEAGLQLSTQDKAALKKSKEAKIGKIQKQAGKKAKQAGRASRKSAREAKIRRAVGTAAQKVQSTKLGKALRRLGSRIKNGERK